MRSLSTPMTLRAFSPRGFKHASLIAAALLLSVSSEVRADIIVPFKIDTPEWYIQVGWEYNPAFGPHPLVEIPPPPVTFWGTPATLNLSTGLIINATGSSTHLVAVHAGEAAPSQTWPFDISVAAPGPPFGARETRVRQVVVHPGAPPHVDVYGAVVGGLLGTVPGPSLIPRFIMIHGSIGVHLQAAPPPPAPQPMVGGCHLQPRSGLPSPGDMDFPAGELLTILDPATSNVTMLIIVDGVPAAGIGSVFVRQGPGGPILMDLRPLMLMHAIDPNGNVLAMGNLALPISVAQVIAAGNAHISVQVTTHPDGEIVGGIGVTPTHDVTSYCTAKKNSLGCTPSMSASGISSATATSGFTISADSVINNKIGIMLYKNSLAGSGQGAIPFTGGTLCFSGSPNRTIGVLSGGTPGPLNDCSGLFSIDMNAFAQGMLGGPPFPQPFLLINGQEVCAQFWGREPGFAPPNNTQLTDAIMWIIGS